MTESRWELATTIALCAALAGGLLWGLGAVAVHDWLQTWDRAGRSAPLLHAGILLGAAAGWTAVLVHLGPMAQSGAALQWQAAAVPRRGFLLRWTAGTVLVVGVVVAVLVIAPGRGAGAPTALATTAVVVGGVLLAGTAWLGQLADARGLLDGLATALALAALGLLAWSSSDTVMVGIAWCAAAARLALGVRRTHPVLPADAPPRWLLVRAAESRWALHASMVMLDGTVARQSRERWDHRSRRWPSTVGAALGPTGARVATVWVRQLPTVLPSLVVTTYLAVSVVETWSMAAATALVALAIGWVGATTSAQSDRWVDAPALQRTFAAVPTGVVLAPSLLSMWLVALAAVAVLAPPAVPSLLLLALPAAVGWRRIRSRHRTDDLWASSPMGAVPLGQLDRAAAGFDVALVAAIVLSSL